MQIALFLNFLQIRVFLNLFNEKTQLEVTDILLKSGAWDQSFSLAENWGNLAKEWLDPENPATELLTDMMSITSIEHNHYLRAIKES